MPVYQYAGYNTRGQVVKGKVKATTQTEAISKLKETGVAIRQIQQLQGLLYKEIQLKRAKVKNKDIVIYVRQFATLIKSGISIVEATKILTDQTDNKILKKTLGEMEEAIRTGQAYSEAASKYPHVFSHLYVNMIRAGEASGNLEEILDRLAVYFEKQHATRQKIKSAMIYPILLTVITFAVTFFMLAYIVPMFSTMFDSYGATLPAVTLWIIKFSHFCTTYGWILLLALIILALGVRLFVQTPKGKYIYSFASLRVPLFGSFVQKALLARFSRTFSTLYAASVPILEALVIVENVVGNEIITRVLRSAQHDLESGRSIAYEMEKHWAIPPLVTRMMHIGEQSGSLDFILEKLAEFYEAEVDQFSERIKAIVEPLLIVILSVVVGGIVVAIMLPMYNILQNIH